MTIDLASAAFGQPIEIVSAVEASVNGQTPGVSGFAFAGTIAARLEISGSSRGSGSIQVLLEHSADGSSWSTLKDFGTVGDGVYNAIGQNVKDYVRLRWVVSGGNPRFTIGAKVRVIGASAHPNPTPVVPLTSPSVQNVVDALVSLGLIAQHD